jgi:hypothetical protein
MRRVLLWLAGADEAILERCPKDRLRLAAMGAMVATTASLAAVSATFTVHQFLHTSLPVGVLAGGCWGLAILTLDRWLVISIRRQSHWAGTLVLALPRVALAVVAGLVIAQPFVLKIFEPEVLTQVAEDKKQEYLSGKKSIDEKYAEIGTLEAQTAKLTKNLASVETGGLLATSPAYRLASQEAGHLRSEAQAAQSRALCELDGSCGSGHVGAGPVYSRKAQRAASLEGQAREAQARSDQLRQRLLSEGSERAAEASSVEHHELTQLLGRLGTLRAKRTQEETTLHHEYARRAGLADRLDGLSALSHKHASVADWSRLITLLILFLDSAPALGKVFMAIGKPTVYEQIQEQEEGAAEKANETRLSAEQEANEVEAGVAVEEAELRRELWRPELEALVSETVQVQADLARLYTERWAAFARKHVEGWVEKNFPQGSSADEDVDLHDESPRHGDGRARKRGARSRSSFLRRPERHSE